MLKPCVHRGCSELVEKGVVRCSEHAPEPWAGTSRLPPGWSKLRQRILRRDGGKCQICDGDATDVDHIVSRARGGGEDPTNLQSICKDCHKAKTLREAREGRTR